MKIWSYAVIWNEEKILEFYLRHYSQYCDKMIFFDNESDDRSREIIESYPNTEIRTYNTNGAFNDAVHMQLKHDAISDAQGNCDYVIVGDCDEIIHHPDLIGFLKSHLNKTAVFYPAGYQMVANVFPQFDQQIYDEVKEGVPNPWYSKPILINPNMIHGFAWVGGQHEIEPDSFFYGDIYHTVPKSVRPEGAYKDHEWGKWKIMHDLLHIFNKEPLKLLHYKFISAEYVTHKHIQYVNRNSESTIDIGAGSEYDKTSTLETAQQEIDRLLSQSETLDI